MNDAAGRTLEMGAGTEAKLRCTLEIVYAESEEEKAAQEARVRAEIGAQTQAFIDKNAGFKRVVEELERGPAFLVGHNCLLGEKISAFAVTPWAFRLSNFIASLSAVSFRMV